MVMSKQRLFCTFCRKDETAIASLIAGPGVHICGDCVAVCNRILAGKPTPGFDGWDTVATEQLLEGLAASEQVVASASEVLHAQVDILRQRGVSWAAIGGALGVSRQAAWERFS